MNGGTCVNVGCIPSKALLDSSERFHAVRDGFAVHGIKVGSVELDLTAMLARKDKIVKTSTQGVAGLFKKHKIERISGSGRLTTADTVEVSNGAETRRITGRRVLIATGSAPIELPGLPFDGQRIVCSTEALNFKEVPQKMAEQLQKALQKQGITFQLQTGAKQAVVENGTTVLCSPEDHDRCHNVGDCSREGETD